MLQGTLCVCTGLLWCVGVGVIVFFLLIFLPHLFSCITLYHLNMDYFEFAL